MDTVTRERYDELFDLYRQVGEENKAVSIELEKQGFRYQEALARAEAAERRMAELEVQLSAWENIQRGAIERQEDIPWEALLVNFRESTVTERHYGDTLISLLEDSIEGQ